jgi:hypothetical protein
LFFQSCILEENSNFFEQKGKEVIDSEVVFAKQWFEANKSLLQKDQISHFARLNLADFEERDFQAIWQNSQKYRFNDGRGAVEVQVEDASTIFPKELEEDWKGENIRTVIHTNLLLIENSANQSFFTYLIRYYPSRKTGRISFTNFNYSKLGNNWEGRIGVFSLSGILLHSFSLVNGKVKETIKSSTNNFYFNTTNQSNGCIITLREICYYIMGPQLADKTLLPEFTIDCVKIFDWSCPHPLILGTPENIGSGQSILGSSKPYLTNDDKLCEPLFEDCIPFPGEDDCQTSKEDLKKLSQMHLIPSLVNLKSL